LGIEEIWEAGNGEEALEFLAKHTIDIVFSDINMPKMDGSGKNDGNPFLYL